MSPLDNATANYIPVQVEIVGDQAHAITGQIWSASQRFLRMTLQASVEAGEPIEMLIEGCRVSGEVAFCQPCPWGYNVGVQLLDRQSIRREPRFPLDLRLFCGHRFYGTQRCCSPRHRCVGLGLGAL